MDNLFDERRRTLKGFIVQSGRVAGRRHVNNLGWTQNCQDAVYVVSVTVAGKEYILGAVSDGCSEGEHSETSALLVVRFVVGESLLLLTNGIPIKEIPAYLYPRLIGFLRSVSSLIYFSDVVEMVNFIKNYLLGTIIGFIHCESEGVVFAAGDGLIQINDSLVIRDQANKPQYPGYFLVDRRFLDESASKLPLGFETTPIVADSFRKLAIATDGFEGGLLHEAWGITRPKGLQKKMNVWSWYDHSFIDDAAIITVERVRAESGVVK